MLRRSSFAPFALSLAVAGCGGEITVVPSQQSAALTSAPCTSAGVVLAAAQEQPFALTSDGARVYWVNVVPGAIRAVSRWGGDVVELAGGQSFPEAIAVDATRVYWTNTGTPELDFADGSVASVGKLGGAVHTLAAAQKFPQSIAVDAAGVYWSAIGGVRATTRYGGPVRQIVASDSVPAFTTDALFVYSADLDGAASILRTPKSGGAPAAITAPMRVASLASDGADLFVRGGDDLETLFRVSGWGGRVATVGSAPSGASFVSTIAVDERFVYFLSGSGVYRLAKQGGVPEAIAADQPFPQGVAVDALDVYWSTAGGTINRVPKHCRAR